jgi:hypothetical protein
MGTGILLLGLKLRRSLLALNLSQEGPPKLLRVVRTVGVQCETFLAFLHFLNQYKQFAEKWQVALLLGHVLCHEALFAVQAL